MLSLIQIDDVPPTHGRTHGLLMNYIDPCGSNKLVIIKKIYYLYSFNAVSDKFPNNIYSYCFFLNAIHYSLHLQDGVAGQAPQHLHHPHTAFVHRNIQRGLATLVILLLVAGTLG